MSTCPVCGNPVVVHEGRHYRVDVQGAVHGCTDQPEGLPKATGEAHTLTLEDVASLTPDRDVVAEVLRP